MKIFVGLTEVSVEDIKKGKNLLHGKYGFSNKVTKELCTEFTNLVLGNNGELYISFHNVSHYDIMVCLLLNFILMNIILI